MRYSLLLAILLLSSCTIFQRDVDDGGEIEIEEIADIDLDAIREKGKLVAIVDNSSTSYFIYKGQPMGNEHDLLQRF